MGNYFRDFPTVLYDAVQDGTTSPKLITNFLKRVKVRDSVLDNISNFSTYTVKSGETPESVSYKFYRTVEYYWIVLLANNVKDRFYDWPLSEQQFETYVNDKYTNPGAIHHYEITQSSGPTSTLDNSHKIEVNSDTSGATSVSNYEYERRIQDNKSQIRILKSEFIPSILEEFRRLINK